MKKTVFVALVVILTHCSHNGSNDPIQFEETSSTSMQHYSSIKASAESSSSSSNEIAIGNSSSSLHYNLDSVMDIIDAFQDSSCFAIYWVSPGISGKILTDDYYKTNENEYRFMLEEGFSDAIYSRNEIEEINRNSREYFRFYSIESSCDTSKYLKEIPIEGYNLIEFDTLDEIRKGMYYDEYEIWYGLIGKEHLNTDSIFYYSLIYDKGEFTYNNISDDSIIQITSYYDLFNSAGLSSGYKKYLSKSDVIDTINGELIYDVSEFFYREYPLAKIGGYEVVNTEGTTYRLLYKEKTGIIYFTWASYIDLILSGQQYISIDSASLPILCEHIDTKFCE